MDRCYFAKEPPKVEVRGDLLFITPVGAHCEIAVTPETLTSFMAVASKALTEHGKRHSARIVRFPSA